MTLVEFETFGKYANAGNYYKVVVHSIATELRFPHVDFKADIEMQALRADQRIIYFASKSSQTYTITKDLPYGIIARLAHSQVYVNGQNIGPSRGNYAAYPHPIKAGSTITVVPTGRSVGNASIYEATPTNASLHIDFIYVGKSGASSYQSWKNPPGKVLVYRNFNVSTGRNTYTATTDLYTHRYIKDVYVNIITSYFDKYYKINDPQYYAVGIRYLSSTEAPSGYQITYELKDFGTKSTSCCPITIYRKRDRKIISTDCVSLGKVTKTYNEPIRIEPYKAIGVAKSRFVENLGTYDIHYWLSDPAKIVQPNPVKVVSIYADKTTLKPGESTVIHVKLKNTSSVQQTKTVGLTTGTAIVGLQTVTIAPNSEKEVTFIFRAPNVSRNFEICVNVTQSDVTDNNPCITITVTEPPRPKLFWTDFGIYINGKKIDPSTPIPAGTTITVIGDLWNDGNATASATVYLTVNGREVKTTRVTVPPRDYVPFRWEITLTKEGSHTICLDYR